MNRNLGVAAGLGLLVMTAFTGPAHAVCPPQDPCSGCPILIEFDANCFAYETSYTKATFTSDPGSQLSVVGLVVSFGVPLNFLTPNCPTTEYTFVMTGLTSAGTVVTVNGPTTNYDTDYAGGTFAVYEGSPCDAPATAADWAANPYGGAVVPATFQNGTAILTGVLCGFHVNVNKTVVGPTTIIGGSYQSNYNFDGGTQFGRVGEGVSLVHGVWCPDLPGCTPANYTAHANGKFDSSHTTLATPSTWGRLKLIYR
ncbi:MAG TPA: hypothetical protein VGK89_10200 [Candidatus Eisenbacteria bacterium]|jgi:hypothetical protein